jgi:hypothetical protein
MVKSTTKTPAGETSSKKKTEVLTSGQVQLIADQIERAISKVFEDLDARLVLALKSPEIQPAITAAVQAAVTDVITKKTEQLNNRLTVLENSVAKLKTEQDDLEQYGRRWNLLFHGVAETDNENCADKVRHLCSSKFDVELSPGAIQRAHRLGGEKEKGSRPIIVRFTDYNTKQSIYKLKRRLKGTRLLVTENLTPTRQALYKQVRECKAVSASWTNDGNIFVINNGKITQIASTKELQKLSTTNK